MISTEVYKGLDLLLAFGGVMAFMFWQLHSVNKEIREARLKKEAEAAAAAAKVDGASDEAATKTSDDDAASETAKAA
ncbi:MAG: hypothetical protein KI785_12980 [Devosiaceae bacterium]|nr:hypothetical protein [Devosiaceae bacterium MH13]